MKLRTATREINFKFDFIAAFAFPRCAFPSISILNTIASEVPIYIYITEWMTISKFHLENTVLILM